MKVVLVWFLFVGGLLALLVAFVTSTPGSSFRGPPPSPTDEDTALAEQLRESVQRLSYGIGERGGHRLSALADAADAIEIALRRSGYSPIDQQFPAAGVTLHNLTAEIHGARSSEIVIFCAHYDSPPRSPGADSDASGCAVLLELAERLSRRTFDRTLRFEFFAGGEGLLAGTDGMGSRVAAKASHTAGERIDAVLSLDTLGFYSDQPGSQTRPFPLTLSYPDHGDFLAFVSDLGSRGLMQRCLAEFRGAGPMPAEGACLPGWMPGLSSGDHASYWREGYNAVLVTDTGSLRNPNYQLMTDTYDRLDYNRMARVVTGLVHVAEALGSSTTPSN